jgi:hypothetical protein
VVQIEGRPHFTVNASYADGWWTIHVPDAGDVTARVRFLDEVEAQARHAIALVTAVPEGSFDITVEVAGHPAVP